MKRMTALLITLALLVIAGCGGSKTADTPVQTPKDSGASGSKLAPPAMDKQVVVMHTAGLDAKWVEALIPGFKKMIKEKYGADIEVIPSVGKVPDFFTKMTTEWPNPSADVYPLYPTMVLDNIDKGYFEPLKPHVAPADWAAFDQETMDRYKGYGYPYDRVWYSMAVRADKNVAVDSWTVLGDPALKGRITFDSAVKVGSGYLTVLAAALAQGVDWKTWQNPDGTIHEEKLIPTLKFLRKWQQNALTLTEGSGTIRPLLRRGESLVSAWWASNVLDEIKEGQPIKLVFPKEGVITWGETNWTVSAKAKNKLAGIEWVKYMMSREGFEAAKAVGLNNSVIPRKDFQFDVDPNAKKPTNVPEISGVAFRMFVESDKNRAKFLELYTKYVLQGAN